MFVATLRHANSIHTLGQDNGPHAVSSDAHCLTFLTLLDYFCRCWLRCFSRIQPSRRYLRELCCRNCSRTHRLALPVSQGSRNSSHARWETGCFCRFICVCRVNRLRLPNYIPGGLHCDGTCKRSSGSRDDSWHYDCRCHIQLDLVGHSGLPCARSLRESNLKRSYVPRVFSPNCYPFHT